jgi:hypothetical protein
MSDNQVSDVMAQAFAAEGVDTLFTLMGDANMYWSAAAGRAGRKSASHPSQRRVTLQHIPL